MHLVIKGPVYEAAGKWACLQDRFCLCRQTQYSVRANARLGAAEGRHTSRMEVFQTVSGHGDELACGDGIIRTYRRHVIILGRQKDHRALSRGCGRGSLIRQQAE